VPFSKDNRPKLPDSYFNFDTAPISVVPPAAGSTVAIPLINDWGPFGEAHLVSSFSEYQALYGYSTDTQGYVAVKQAFIGEGIDGRLGAGAVLVYRFGDSGAGAASKTLQNTTPENALKLTAKYKGTRGNDLRVTVRVNAGDNTKHDLLILDGTTQLESYTYIQAEVAKVAALINKRSNWVTAESLKTGTKLATVTASALTGGDDGAEPTTEDWAAAFDAIALERFGVIAPANLTDESVQVALEQFVRDQNDNKNKRFMAVVGGAIGEELSDAEERSESLADPEMVNVGVGTYRSPDLGPGGTSMELSTAQLAPRVAGVLAQKGEYAALTYARLAGLEIVKGPTDAEIAAAYDAGVLVFARDDDPDAPTHIKVGHSTWTEVDADGELNSQGDPIRPYFIYREPKYVRTMHGIQTDLAAYFRREILGVRPVNDDTRDAVVSEAKHILDERERLGVIQPGWKVGVDQDPPPSDDDEFVALAMELKFGRALKQVYVTITVG
jgi:tail sheath protein